MRAIGGTKKNIYIYNLQLGQFLYRRIRQSKKVFFDWRSKPAFYTAQKELLTQSFSTERSDSQIQWNKIDDSTEYISRIAPSKPFVNPSQQKHAHAHTPIPATTQQYHTTAPTLAWLLSLLLFAASPASSVDHTMADGSSARYRRPFRSNSYAGCSIHGSRLIATPPTRLEEGSSRVEHAWLAENARSTKLPTDFRLPYGSSPSHQPPPERAQTL